MSLGGVLSYFATNLEFLIFTQSCITGIGAALLTGPCMVVVNQYFEKRLALAQSISSCGVSIGSMVVPQLIRYLFSLYGVRITLLISGGIEAVIILFALVFRPLPQRPVKKASKSETLNEGQPPLNVEDLNDAATCYQDLAVNMKSNHIKKDKTEYETTSLNMVSSYEENIADIELDMSNFEAGEQEAHFEQEENNLQANFLSNANDTSNSDIVIEYSETKTYGSKCCKRRPILLDCSIFLLPHFYLIIGQHIFGSVVALFSAFLPATAEEAGLNTFEAATLLTIFAGVDCGSRFLSGVIVHSRKIKSHHLLALSLIVEGLLYHLTKYYTSSALMTMYAVLFGFFCGAIPAMDPVVMMDFLGQAYLSTSLGITMLTHGAILAGITPLLGFLKDQTGTYEHSYHLMGTFAILSGIFLLLEPLAGKIKRLTTKKSTDFLPIEKQK